MSDMNDRAHKMNRTDDFFYKDWKKKNFGDNEEPQSLENKHKEILMNNPELKEYYGDEIAFAIAFAPQQAIDDYMMGLIGTRALIYYIDGEKDESLLEPTQRETANTIADMYRGWYEHRKGIKLSKDDYPSELDIQDMYKDWLTTRGETVLPMSEPQGNDLPEMYLDWHIRGNIIFGGKQEFDDKMYRDRNTRYIQDRLKQLHNDKGFSEGWDDAHERWVDTDEWGDNEVAMLDEQISLARDVGNDNEIEYSEGFKSGWVAGKLEKQMSGYGKNYKGREPKAVDILDLLIKRYENADSKMKREVDKPLNIKKAESIISNMPNVPDIKHSEMNEPSYYDYWKDYIRVLPKEEYPSKEEYYAALFHELIHSTSHAKRLNRNPSAYDEDMEARAREELIAELGAAILGSKVGIETNEMDDPTEYIRHWAEKLPGGQNGAFDKDKLPKKTQRMLRRAMDDAEEAVEYILDEDGENDKDTKMKRSTPEAIMPPVISCPSFGKHKKPKPPGFMPKMPGQKRRR